MGAHLIRHLSQKSEALTARVQQGHKLGARLLVMAALRRVAASEEKPLGRRDLHVLRPLGRTDTVVGALFCE